MYPYGQPTGQEGYGYQYNQGQAQMPYQSGMQQPMRTGMQSGMQQPMQSGMQTMQQPMGFQQTGMPTQSGVGGMQTQQLGMQSGMNLQHMQPSGHMQPPMQTMQQPMQTGMSGVQQPLQTGLPSMPTGMGGYVSTAPTATPQGNPLARIPNKRLSFITAEDQANFAQLFRASMSPGEEALSGDVARTVLLRSNLPSSTLGDIWQLADTQRSGKLMFPEFCVAMYLCSKCLRGEPVPFTLNARISKEVGDMVSEISFGVIDPVQSEQTNQFTQLRQQQTGSGALQNPLLQPWASIQSQPPGGFGLQGQATSGFGVQPLATGGYGLQSQATGGYGLQNQITGMQTQPSGFGMQPQVTGGFSGLQPQATGGYMQPQTTGGFGLQPQTTDGFTQPQTTGGFIQPQTTGGFALQSQPTGGLQPQMTGPMPLTAMPTGKPGQWGFSNAPTPGMDLLQSSFMPQATGSEAVLLQQKLQAQPTGVRKTQHVSYSMSKEEKQTYDGIFRQWDKTRSGFIDGTTAIAIFGKSGLGNTELETIWNLCDRGNRGKLDRDEFSVAMHLIYRKLNGQDIPVRLPPELIPPSQQRIDESVEQMKKFLKDSKPLQTYSKPHHTDDAKKLQDASVFKNDDSDLGAYKSASRYRSTGSLNKQSTGSSSLKKSGTLSNSNDIEVLVKKVREKRILLEAADTQEDEDLELEQNLEAQNKRAINELKVRIRETQDRLVRAGKAGSAGSDSSNERGDMLRKLQNLSDELPSLMKSIRNVEAEITDTRLAIMQRRFEKENPGAKIVGTGPNGSVTASDRAAAKRRAELRARMAAITGKQAPGGDASSAFEEFERQLVSAKQQAEANAASNETSLRAVEESLAGLGYDLRSQLNADSDPKADRERRRWEEAVGVEPEVKDLILELRSPAANTVPTPTLQKTPVSQPSTAAHISAPVSANSTGNSFPSGTKETSAQRIACIRAEAQRRTQEKFAKAGIHLKNRNELKEAAKEAAKEARQPSAPSSPARHTHPATTPAAAPMVVDEEDEEEKQLRIELEAEREKAAEREAEAKARQEARDRRKAEMMAEREKLRSRQIAMQNQKSDDDYDDNWDDKPVEEKKPVQTWRPQSKTDIAPPNVSATPKVESTVKRPSWMPPKKESEPTPVSASAAAAAAVVSGDVQAPTAVPKQPYPVKTAEPVKPAAQVAAQPAAAQPIEPVKTGAQPKSGFNPFHRPAPPKAAAPADEGWGSDASEDEEEERTRGGATAQQLASLLFGTMGSQRPPESQQPSRPPSSTSIKAEDPTTATVPTSVPEMPEELTSRAPVPESVAPAPPAAPLAAPPAPSLPHAAPPSPPVQQQEDLYYQCQQAQPEQTYKQYQQPEQQYQRQEYQLQEYHQDQYPEQHYQEQPQYEDPYAKSAAAPSVAPPAPPLAPPAAPPAPPAPSTGEYEKDEFAGALSAPSHTPAPPLPPMRGFGAPPLPPPALSTSGPPTPPGPPPPVSSNDSAAPAGVPGLGNALLGEISSGGFKLKKVDKSQQKVSGGDLGRVL